MPAPDSITVEQLVKLIGTPRNPILLDVRSAEDFSAEPLLIPSARRADVDALDSLLPVLRGQPVVAVCQHGHRLSQGAAAWLRHGGVSAEYLEGGFDAWRQGRHPTLDSRKLPARDSLDRTIWVTRSRPKIDRIACPWLIRRFVDPRAVFLYVAPSDVVGVSERFGGAPYDIEDVFWSHRGELCTFDVMIAEFGLEIPALGHLARIVRGADTDRLDIEPEAAGLLAASLGLSRMYSNDLEQLEAGLLLYDAFYRWARDASEETHNWPTNKPRS